MTGPEITRWLLMAIVGGVLGAVAMETAMWGMSHAGLTRGGMIVALGGLITRSRANAFRVGVLVHVVAGIIFALGYTLAMELTGFVHLPASLVLGLGIGFVHGMAVSLGLVWIVAEQHPLEEFREADLAIGLCHLLGHVVYGGVVGLVVGLASA